MQIQTGNSIQQLLCRYLNLPLHTFNLFMVSTVETAHAIKTLLCSYLLETMTSGGNTRLALCCFKFRKEENTLGSQEYNSDHLQDRHNCREWIFVWYTSVQVSESLRQVLGIFRLLCLLVARDSNYTETWKILPSIKMSCSPGSARCLNKSEMVHVTV